MLGRRLGFTMNHDVLTKSGNVALIGRPNVGKSTLLNAALEQSLAIVSHAPQTTRDTLLGIVQHGEAEIALLDTPGLHKAESALGRRMNRAARKAASEADVVVFVTDLPRNADRAKRPLEPHRGDLTLLSDLGTEAPVLCVVNKVDTLGDKSKMLPLLDALSRVRSFASIVPVSALAADGVDRVLSEVAALLPAAAPRFEPGSLTDRPMRFFASEYVREQVLKATRAEVPHATAVTVDRYEEGTGAHRVDATIYVERDGQKRILIGKGGSTLRGIGERARHKLAELVGHPVDLFLFVKVRKDWRDDARSLGELGYGSDD